VRELLGFFLMSQGSCAAHTLTSRRLLSPLLWETLIVFSFEPLQTTSCFSEFSFQICPPESHERPSGLNRKSRREVGSDNHI
jgi:hypothetical protein